MVARTKKVNTIRKKNITLPDSIEEKIALIRERTGAQSDSEVIRSALKVYNLVVFSGDGSFKISNKDGAEKEVMLL